MSILWAIGSSRKDKTFGHHEDMKNMASGLRKAGWDVL